MNSDPPIGAIAFGKSGIGYPVVEVHPDRIVLMRDGSPWVVNPVAIVRWEMPIQVGDRVRIAPIDAVGIVAQLDHEYREARVNDIEGYVHPVTGYQVISQWFSYFELIKESQL